MATKGDVSDLDELVYGGSPMIPLVSGFSRSRRSGIVQNTVEAGRTRQRKKFYGNCYQAEATFFFQTPQQQDFIKVFFERNEGKTFVCHLSADRPIVEPYTVRVISEWSDDSVNAKYGTMTVTLEIDSVRIPELDTTMYMLYNALGDGLYDMMSLLNKSVPLLPNYYEFYELKLLQITEHNDDLEVQSGRLETLSGDSQPSLGGLS